ncbi:MAG: cyclic nucleotide-binding domain-containing protein, partial [Myxococcales bacterium]|nr:cyclic nucleotide-binding domain-containing protein [Myxococcales bacterium]
RRIAAIGTTVIRRGETGHGLVLVVRGQLDVHAERSDGARVSLEAIGPGDYVGEIGLVARAPATAYVVAVTESELLVLDAADFYEVAGQFPLLWAAVAAVASRRVLEQEQRLRI